VADGDGGGGAVAAAAANGGKLHPRRSRGGGEGLDHHQHTQEAFSLFLPNPRLSFPLLTLSKLFSRLAESLKQNETSLREPVEKKREREREGAEEE
jgi:hypothetical protein